MLVLVIGRIILVVTTRIWMGKPMMEDGLFQIRTIIVSMCLRRSMMDGIIELIHTLQQLMETNMAQIIKP